MIKDIERKGLAFENWHTNYMNLNFVKVTFFWMELFLEKNGLGQELLVLTF